ncbi:MAG TPA: bacillithiol system redox-active protein YtxJ [Chitinophaga sp.]
MNWQPLTTEEQLVTINGLSRHQPVAIFKHSTRCSISGMIKMRLERAAVPADVAFFYLDLIRYRNVSNRIAMDYGVEHESPQLLLIRDGQCIYHESHSGISMDEVAEKAVL